MVSWAFPCLIRGTFIHIVDIGNEKKPLILGICWIVVPLTIIQDLSNFEFNLSPPLISNIWISLILALGFRHCWEEVCSCVLQARKVLEYVKFCKLERKWKNSIQVEKSLHYSISLRFSLQHLEKLFHF